LPLHGRFLSRGPPVKLRECLDWNAFSDLRKNHAYYILPIGKVFVANPAQAVALARPLAVSGVKGVTTGRLGRGDWI
jgi:hypothetical protein